MNSDLYQQIIITYKETGSIKETAERLSTYPIKVRRVLLTEGLWSSKTSRAIADFSSQGLTTAEIAEKMCVSEKAIQQLIPYSRGEYNLEEKTCDAIRSNEYRERMKQAEGRQVFVNTNKNAIGDIVMKKEVKAVKLHLELDTRDADMEVLKQYGKVEDGISRDLIVPADMTLHALHYAIQKAFGWQNSHLHNFALPENLFNTMTEYGIPKWLEYCGVYFRCPDEENEDIFWDDDYEEGQSFKTWLKHKYTGPYSYGGITEHLMEAQNMARNLLKEFGGKKREEFELFAGGRMDELLERLTISSIMLPKGKTAELEKIKGASKVFEKYYDEYATMAIELTKLEDDQGMDVYERGYKLGKLDGEFKRLVGLTDMEIQPITDTLVYSYDYGDGWEVKITCEDVYGCKDSWDSEGLFIAPVTEEQVFKDQKPYDINGNPISGELSDQIATVISQWKPLCIAADGMPVLDDVGGIYGYCNFLLGLHGKEQNGPYEDKESTKEWAKMLGWTGKMSTPEKML